jgi:prolyl-tRNA synthetase
MRVSKAFIPTVKETPGEAEIPSHKLMLRAGLMRKVASGFYEYLPLGQKSSLKSIRSSARKWKGQAPRKC